VVIIELAAPLEDCVRDVVDIDLLRPRWMRDAACRGQGFDTWFPTDEVGEQAESARRVCGGCAVRAECLEYALEARVRHGLWGGLSTRERAALTRRRVPGRADACRRHYAS
jgi:WhiB family redox-sensing transcriptional regulator